jgi:hypothetical protein
MMTAMAKRPWWHDAPVGRSHQDFAKIYTVAWRAKKNKRKWTYCWTVWLRGGRRSSACLDGKRRRRDAQPSAAAVSWRLLGDDRAVIDRANAVLKQRRAPSSV